MRNGTGCDAPVTASRLGACSDVWHAALCSAISNVQIRFLNGVEKPGGMAQILVTLFGASIVALAGIFAIWSDQRQRRAQIMRSSL